MNQKLFIVKQQNGIKFRSTTEYIEMWWNNAEVTK